MLAFSIKPLPAPAVSDRNTFRKFIKLFNLLENPTGMALRGGFTH